MTTKAKKPGKTREADSDSAVLQEAVAAVVRMCQAQLDLELTIDPHPADPRQAGIEYGVGVAVTTDSGSRQLTVMADRPSGEILARNLFGLTTPNPPAVEDIADALAEIANVAAGAVTDPNRHAGESVRTGSPTFLAETECATFFAAGDPGLAQTIRGGDDLAAHIVLTWQEG